MIAREIKVFDPADGFGPIADLTEITDPTVVRRGNQWWMFAAGQLKGDRNQHLFSASLSAGAPLSATGWQLTPRPGDPSRIALLAGHDRSCAWDGIGGRHCPSFIRGWDPHGNRWVERIYYANSASNPWGPYTIACLEWNGSQWIDQTEPVFVATETWEHGSVYEPSLVYADGMWKMWYVAGSNFENYIVHGFAESGDGIAGWSEHRIFAPPEQKIFDFCVAKCGAAYEAVFSRVWPAQAPAPPETGLWWCRADAPIFDFSAWSDPIQLMTAEDRGWHAGPWKPSLCYDEANQRMFVFFAGTRKTNDPGPFPYVFTLGCLEIEGSILPLVRP